MVLDGLPRLAGVGRDGETVGMTDLAQQMEVLARRLDALEVENTELRSQLDDAPATAPAESRRFGRRNLLRLGGVAAAVGAGSVLLRPGVAGATTGAMQFGAENDAGATGTGLTSSNATDTLHVANTSGASDSAAITAHIAGASSNSRAIHALNDGLSDAIVGEVTSSDPAASGAGVVGLGTDFGGVVGISSGSGPGVGAIGFGGTGSPIVGWTADTSSTTPTIEAEQDGLGIGVYAHIESATNNLAAVRAKTLGVGAGIDASSSHGTGGKFTGSKAQIQLVPGSGSTHPSTGSKGQFYVDKFGHLWYCYATNVWKKLA